MADAGAVLDEDEDVTRQSAPRAQRRLRVPALRPVPPHDRVREHRPSACACASGPKDADPRARRASCCTWSASTGWRTAIRPSCRAASGSAWRWPARWPREPQVLLLDEPFGALDAKVRQELRSWLRRLHDEIHVTSMFVTHDQEEAFEVADQVVVMNQGRIEQVGTPGGGLRAPRQRVRHGFPGQRQRVPRAGRNGGGAGGRRHTSGRTRSSSSTNRPATRASPRRCCT